MKKLFCALLILLASLTADSININSSYNYYRGLPDGSWNGNTGALLSAELAGAYYDSAALQIGGSYGLYNWDGRENLVFQSPQELQWIAFVTGGISSSYEQFNGGIVYDRIFTENFCIYNLNPSFDQLRLQAGCQINPADEIGIWGTIALTTAEESALGIPTRFRAVNQVNLFATHFFNEAAKISIWGGVPYGNSLLYGSHPAGLFTAGFYLKAPLTHCLSIEGVGSYMGARDVGGFEKSRSYAASILIGITYSFTTGCSYYRLPYMSLASHSHFLVDTNYNQ